MSVGNNDLRGTSKRRTILKSLLGVSLAAVLSPILYVAGRYLGYVKGSKNGDVMIAQSDVSAEHPSKLINIDDQPVLVIFQPDKGVRAFTATCTHLGCTVSYQPEMPQFYCKCHHGRYDADGVNVEGTRPKKPLTELTITAKGDQLDISLKPKTKG